MAIEGVCIALADNWDVPTPTWTRLDSTPNLVASYSIRRGRQDEQEKTGTGTATVEINDVGGAFDPTYPASPYGDAIDGRQMAIGLWNPVTDSWSTLFRGFADGYDYTVDPSGRVVRVAIELVDGLDYLANAEAVPGNAGHPPPTASEGDVFYEDAEVDARIKAALLNAGWPTELQTIFSGNVNVKETVYSPGTPFLTIVQDAADAEFPGVANVYVSREGKVTFHGRHARFDPEAVAASASAGAWTFTRWKVGGGSALEADAAQLRGLSFARSRKNIINAAMALPHRSGSAPTDPDPPLTPTQIEGQILFDATSIGRFGVRSWSANDLYTKGHKTNPTNDLSETLNFAKYYRDNYKDPKTRVTQLVFRSLAPTDPRAPATWALLCGVEVSDTVRISLPFPGGGGFDEEEFFVEGISYDVRPLNADYADVTLSLDVSPVGYYEHDPFGDDGGGGGVPFKAYTGAEEATSLDPSTPASFGVAFNVIAADVVLTGVQFYWPIGTAVAVPVKLWAIDGTLLDSMTYTIPGVVGWQEAVFPTPVPLTNGTSYIVTYWAGGADFGAKLAPTAWPRTIGSLATTAGETGPGRATSGAATTAPLTTTTEDRMVSPILETT
jgi:Domain of unknown function (DUF4082)